MSGIRSVFIVIGIGAVLACGSSRGQTAADPESPEVAPVNKQQIDSALKLTREAAELYEIMLDSAVRTPAKLQPEPILRWSNPAAGEVHGNVFLWTLGQRPVAVGSLFKWFSPHTHMSHEFHSLAEKSLHASFGGKPAWTTSEPGLRFAALPEAPVPSAAAAQRLLQMRQLSKDFSATKKERDGSVGELRLLSQPVYRYAAPSDGIVDGGLFAFVQGTDPDLFLLLEARSDSGQARWCFAASRMNGVGLTLRYRDQNVWSAEVMSWAEINSHRGIYTSFMHKAVPNSSGAQGSTQP